MDKVFKQLKNETKEIKATLNFEARNRPVKKRNKDKEFVYNWNYFGNFIDEKWKITKRNNNKWIICGF